MYSEFFGFTEKPFQVTPDTRFLYLSHNHHGVLHTLKYGIEERKGFMLLTGEVGTGKTLSLRTLLNNLDDTVATSLILNPQLSRMELIKTINRDFGIELKKNSIKDQIEHLNDFLLHCASEGKNALVIVDEAQHLSAEALEMTRLLSNLETETHKLLQILLVGQPELEDLLRDPALRQLRQRIQIYCKLSPLDVEGTGEYIIHRIKQAGPSANIAFEESSIEKIHQLTRGIPRLINTLCDYCLMAAYLKGIRIITKKVVETAFAETRGDIPYVTYP